MAKTQTKRPKKAEQHEDSRVITLDSGTKVTVSALGVRHIRQFSTVMGRVLNVASASGILDALMAEDDKSIDHRLSAEALLAKGAAAQFLPVVLTEAIDLLEGCCEVEGQEFEDLPHWDLPLLAEAWLELSFGSPGKLKPWVGIAKNLINLFTAKKTKGSGSSSSS